MVRILLIDLFADFDPLNGQYRLCAIIGQSTPSCRIDWRRKRPTTLALGRLYSQMIHYSSGSLFQNCFLLNIYLIVHHRKPGLMGPSEEWTLS